jgi:hypothetical protein
MGKNNARFSEVTNKPNGKPTRRVPMPDYAKFGMLFQTGELAVTLCQVDYLGDLSSGSIGIGPIVRLALWSTRLTGFSTWITFYHSM